MTNPPHSHNGVTTKNNNRQVKPYLYHRTQHTKLGLSQKRCFGPPPHPPTPPSKLNKTPKTNYLKKKLKFLPKYVKSHRFKKNLENVCPKISTNKTPKSNCFKNNLANFLILTSVLGIFYCLLGTKC